MAGARVGNGKGLMALVVVAVLVMCGGRMASAASNLVPAVYVFGDSTVDVGMNGPLPLPYGIDLPQEYLPTGRVSNGYNVADYISKLLGFKMSPPAYMSLTPETSHEILRGFGGVNYASAGCGILNTTRLAKCFSMAEQVEFFANTKSKMTEYTGGAGSVAQLQATVDMSSTTVPAAPAMADDEKEKSTNQILQALDALSHTLYQARSNFRSTSLALPRSAAADVNDAAEAAGADAPRPRSRRLSLMAPFRSRSSSKLDKNENADDDEDDDDDDEDDTVAPLKNTPGFAAVAAAEANGDSAKKGRIWSWAPIRALSHIGMRRMGCLFSVEVVAAQGLPPSMNGLRLAVVVRKKEARDGAVQTMPARAEQGAADFDETLFIRCHLYGTGGGSGGKPLRFEPRPFLLSLLAVEAPELDFGRSIVDLSLFAKEFTDKCQQGECVRQWDMVFPLAGKAKGGEMVIKFAFQSIDDGGGAGMYSQPESAAAAETEKSSSSSSLSSLARKIRKSSFSMMLTPRVTRTDPMLAPNMRGIDNFKLDDDVATKEEQQKEAPQPEKEEQQKEAPEPETKVEQKEAPGPVTEEQHKEVPEPVTEEQQEAPEKEAVEEQQNEPVPEMAEDAQANDDDDVKIPDFEVVDKGVEAQEENVDDLKEEAAGGEGVKEALQPMAMLCDVADVAADESVEPPPPQEEVAPLDDAKEEELAGESLQVPEQEGGGKDDAAGKSPPPGGFGWRTIAIVVAPVAVLVSKTLAGR